MFIAWHLPIKNMIFISIITRHWIIFIISTQILFTLIQFIIIFTKEGMENPFCKILFCIGRILLLLLLLLVLL